MKLLSQESKLVAAGCHLISSPDQRIQKCLAVVKQAKKAETISKYVANANIGKAK